MFDYSLCSFDIHILKLVKDRAPQIFLNSYDKCFYLKIYFHGNIYQKYNNSALLNYDQPGI